MAFPLLLAAFGLAGAFFIFAAIGIGGSVFVVKFIPETRGRSLEQVEHYFYALYNGNGKKIVPETSVLNNSRPAALR
ncbi:Probable metabolite transport protein CsbC [Pantoea agglomerans]|uniref:Probable metabolite transport protein CsbC n=1 Tax=Enterobacter agglomerans TaxID=549 RepID=A0A379LR16_ENTAG|nr:Probable metabolite transport protein CsbC [Pantoea agglomerans]